MLLAKAQETSEPFKRLDRNKDGKITKDEFSSPLFEQIDTNKDGISTADEDRALFVVALPVLATSQEFPTP